MSGSLSRPSSTISCPNPLGPSTRKGPDEFHADEWAAFCEDLIAKDIQSVKALPKLSCGGSLDELDRNFVRPTTPRSSPTYPVAATAPPPLASQVNINDSAIKAPPSLATQEDVAKIRDDVSQVRGEFLNEANDARCLWAETQRVREHAEELLRLNSQLQKRSVLEEMRTHKAEMKCLQQAIHNVTDAFNGDAMMNQNFRLQEIDDKMDSLAGATKQLTEDNSWLQKSIHQTTSHLSDLSAQIGSAATAQKEFQIHVSRDMRKIIHEELQSIRGGLQNTLQDQLEEITTTMLSPLHAELKELRASITELLNRKQYKSNMKDTMQNVSEYVASEQFKSIEQRLELLHSSMARLQEGHTNSTTSTSKRLADICNSVSETMGPQSKLFGRLEEVSCGLQHIECWTQRADEEFKRESQQLVAARKHRDKILSQLEGGGGSSKSGRCANCIDLEAKVDLLHDELEMAGVKLLQSLAEIERRGNIEINEKTGDVEILREIKFIPKKPGEQPESVFLAPKEAEAVLVDIAAVWQHFKVPMLIEGHTKGGDLTDNPQFWQKLADNRAQTIVDALRKLGVEHEKMTAAGRPGKKGLNKPTTVINLDIFPED